MSSQIEVQIPKQVKETLDTVAIRYGLYFGKRALMGSLMKQHGHLLRQIQKSQNLQERENLREEFRKQAQPYFSQIAPLNRALSKLDKEIIPAKLTSCGYTITPITTAPSELLPQKGKSQ